MKIETLNVPPLFELRGYSGYGEGYEEEVVYPQDIWEAKVGDKWVAENPSGVIRDEHNEYLEVIYKSKDNKVAVLRYRATGTYDNPNHEEWEEEKIFIVTFNREFPEVKEVEI